MQDIAVVNEAWRKECWELLVVILSIDVDVGVGFNKGKRAVKSTVKVQECRAEHDTRCCNKIVASTTFAT